MPDLFIIAGPNGAGKTTASMTILPEILNCRQFVNADEIAKGISPFEPESVSFEAGRIMLQRIFHLIGEQETFAFETTLATRSYQSLIRFAKNHGYQVYILFFHLNNVELAKERVAGRVKRGGHNIPDETIERRYGRGLSNFFNIFMGICDKWSLFDNSLSTPMLIANGNSLGAEIIDEKSLWSNLVEQYGNKSKIRR